MPGPLHPSTLQDKALLLLVALVTVLFGVVLWPLIGAVLWAVFIAIVFSSLQDRSVQVCRGRRGWAAFGTLLVIVVIVLIPMALLASAVAQEATAFYERIKSGQYAIGDHFQQVMNALPEWARALLDRVGLEDLGAVQRKLVSALAASSQQITVRAFTIGQNTLEFLLNFFVMLYLLFFLLRDGKRIAALAIRALPLEPYHTRRVIDHFATVVRATVKGNVLVALVQGALGWVAFSVLGITGALLWGAVMALLSLLPAVGAGLVWGPVAIYLLATGSITAGLGLVAWGVLVIGLVDNVLRPVLVGKETRMPDYLVLIATLGGLAVFGINGFVIGPVIAALFLVCWDMLTEEREQQHASPAGVSPLAVPPPAATSTPPASAPASTPRPD
ncbi:AI-2E family transporter [Ramlibacter tataouinensis]|uniref:Membrane protein n=1 Tax=Ramlibacter tataouinensis TaxID=94132 RepID=A0A127JV53_9BURK|nr:AI-2E family transporter [Ramlibacter tataouinensis]AMO23887.1 membrane protein [Ramlibacter tataouinensis]